MHWNIRAVSDAIDQCLEANDHYDQWLDQTAHINAYYWHMETVGDDRCLPWGYRNRFVVEV